MPYAALADLVLIVHLGFVVFVVAGGLLVLRWPRVAWVHLPAAAWGVAIELFGWTCPLTPLENELRQAAGAAAYTGSFVEHYLVPVVYPPGLTRAVQIALGVALAALSAGVYALAWRRHRGPAGLG